MIISRLKQKLSNRFIRNFGWMGGAELFNRFSRLLTVVVLARVLNSYDYGLAAIVLTVIEFGTVFTLNVGISGKLIQTSKEDLDELCETAYWMLWILAVGLCLLQVVFAFPIALFYSETKLILPICISALMYLGLPFYAVQFALLNRENRLSVSALCNVVFGFGSNILTVVFALMGFGMWAIVLPIVIMSPTWIVLSRLNHAWRPSKPFTLYRWHEITNFAADVLGVELLTKLRANLDYLLIGPFLGVEALGIYFFAFNAGLGTSLSIISALTNSLFPHLCDVREDLTQLRKQYNSSLKASASIMIPIIGLQTFLAPLYVPLVYGQKWESAIPILMLICLSAFPRPFAESASILLRTVGETRVNLYWNFIFTIVFALVLLFSVRFGITWVAASVMIVHITALPIFTVWVSCFVFSKLRVSIG